VDIHPVKHKNTFLENYFQPFTLCIEQQGIDKVAVVC
jgi:hypothetical protein